LTHESTAHSILRGEQETQHDHGDLVVGELSNENLPVLLGLISLSKSGVNHLLDPSVDEARDLGSLGHVDFGFGGDGGEDDHGFLSSLDGVVNLRGEGWVSEEGRGEVSEVRRDKG